MVPDLTHLLKSRMNFKNLFHQTCPVSTSMSPSWNPCLQRGHPGTWGLRLVLRKVLVVAGGGGLSGAVWCLGRRSSYETGGSRGRNDWGFWIKLGWGDGEGRRQVWGVLEGCYLGWTWSGGRGKDLRLCDDPCVVLLTGGSDICWGRT